MTPQRYNELKDNMDPTLRMELDTIRTYLDINNGDKNYGKASVMIGAGFSKNADKDVDASMKDWTELGRVFYTKLYGKEPSDSDLLNLSPIRLASMVEASFGRAFLDKMIAHSLPDTQFRPNELYRDLLNLRWRDVFTTNYDRLLERTYSVKGMNRHYNVVTNKETLIYEDSPRIIKLHGSFPNIHPYIITEEDFRTYPQKYPEFVNTVKQSLIENLFCLIGFSSDDPNFLSWIGWMRDVMGKLTMPVYCITYNKNVHGAQVRLFADRRIQLVNLTGIKGVNGYREALEFLFKYLSEDFGTTKYNWECTLSYKLENEKEINNTLEKAAKIRRSYPGWLVLPEDYYPLFQDASNSYIIANNIGKIKDENTKVNIFFEFDWRLYISLTPRHFDWYINQLETIKIHLDDNFEIRQKKIWLLISLLNICRHLNVQDKYQEICAIIEKNLYGMSDSVIDRFYNEICLNYLSRLEYEKAYTIINKWTINSLDFKGRILKATITYECNHRLEAITELEDIRKEIRSQRLANNLKSTNLQETCMQRTSGLLKVFDLGFYAREGKNEKPYWTNDYLSFVVELQKEQKKPIEHIHGFNIHSRSISWNMGGLGFVHDYLYAYRILDWMEESGYPIGTDKILLNTASLSLAINKILPYEFVYAVSAIVRSCNNNIISNVLTRDNIGKATRDEIEEIFSIYIPYIERIEEEGNESRLAKEKCCISILAKLCIKSSEENTKALFRIMLKCLNKHIIGINRDDFNTVFSCLSPSTLSIFITDLFTLPLSIEGLSISIPTKGGVFGIDQKVIDFLEEGLKSDSQKESREAYKRIKCLYYVLSDDAKRQLKESIINWRDTEHQTTFMRESYHYFPYDKMEHIDIIKTSQTEIDDLDIGKLKIKGSSEPLSSLNHFINLISPNIFLCDVEHKNTFFSKICAFLKENEDVLQKNDSYDFLGGLRHIASILMKNIEICLINAQIIECDKDILNDLAQVIERYVSYGFACTFTLTLLKKSTGNIQYVKRSVVESLFSGDSEKVADLLSSLLQVLADNFDDGIMDKLESYIEFSNNDDVPSYIQFCKQLVHDAIYPKEHIKKILTLLMNLSDKVKKSSIGMSLVSEIEYESLRLAKELVKSYEVPLKDKAITTWRSINEDVNTFNDVRLK